MLYFIFTVDGDWDEYFDRRLSEKERAPDKQKLLGLIDQEIRLASSVIGGRFIHFVHTSPRVRDFFVQPEFMARWKEIESKGGSVGVHCHEDEPGRAYYFDDQARMEAAVGFLAKKLSGGGLKPLAFRGGYMTFSPKTIPILEENGIFLDLSCDPGRFQRHGDVLVSDWRGAPDNFYRMSYDDHRRAGTSNVFEVPLGIYIETQPLLKIWRRARQLEKRKGDVVVSVLAHTYDFTRPRMVLKIKLALNILKRYGTFINARQALDLVAGKA